MGDTAPATEAAVADADGGADDGGAGGSARTGQGSARPLLRQWRVGRPRCSLYTPSLHLSAPQP